MIITCPTCATRYTLADSSVGPQGRKVRCAKCGHMWWQRPEEDEPTALYHHHDDDDDGVTEMYVPPKKARSMRTPGQRTAIRRAVIGWGVLLAVLGGLGAVGWLGRDTVVTLWPPANLLYRTLGVEVVPSGQGLQLQSVQSEMKTDGGAKVLIVDGQILNVATDLIVLPPLRATSYDPDHKPVRSWTIQPTPDRLLPGAVATFRDVQRDPGDVAEVTVTFGN